jgi:oxaloacetate decarboxylase alpha subunit
MTRRVGLIDTTLRDGSQSLWATRMTTAMMLPVAKHLQNSGVDCVDVSSHSGFATAVRYLNDDPWERLRALRTLMPRPELAGAASGNRWGFRLAPDDVAELFTELCVRNGVSRIRSQNGLLDLDTIVDTLVHAKSLGAKTTAGFVYSLSPVHTDELYESKIREVIERADVDYIMIKDSGGLLTPDRAGSFIDAVRRGAGDRKVTLHSHCMTGLAPRVYMVGVEHGVDQVECAIWPLAQGNSQPSMQTVVRNLQEEGYDVDVDLAEIHAASDFLVRVSEQSGLPMGQPVEYDHFHYQHQIPGGMLSNFESQLRDSGLFDRLHEILEEARIVRAELGWPTMVTPFSQFVINQALLNVISGNRYETVPDEVKRYAFGHYGQLLAPVDPDVLDKIISRGSPDIVEAPDTVEPALPGLRRRYPHADDGELFLRYMLPEAAVDNMLRNKTTVDLTDDGSSFGRRRITSEVIALIDQAARFNEVGEVTITKGRLSVRVES